MPDLTRSPAWRAPPPGPVYTWTLRWRQSKKGADPANADREAGENPLLVSPEEQKSGADLLNADKETEGSPLPASSEDGQGAALENAEGDVG